MGRWADTEIDQGAQGSWDRTGKDKTGKDRTIMGTEMQSPYGLIDVVARLFAS